MGAVRSKQDTTRVLGLVVGAVATTFLGNMVPATVDRKIVAAGEVVLGYLLPGFVKNNPLIAGVGDGMIAAGGLTLVKEMGVLNGIPIIAGYKELSTINGPTPRTARKVSEVARESNYRPTVSQMMNGVYYRRQYDGR